MTRFGMAVFGDSSRFGDTGGPPPTTSEPRKAMTSNRLPQKLDHLFSLGDQMLAGLLIHEVTLDVKQNTHARPSPVLNAARAAEVQAIADRLDGLRAGLLR